MDTADVLPLASAQLDDRVSDAKRRPSPYASIAGKLVDNGYSAIPIMPGTKRPGSYVNKQWYGSADWQRFCDRLPTDIELPIWERWPDAGICVAINHELKVVDIDTDEHALLEAVLAILPDSPVKKRGAKGFSAFYRGSGAIKSTPFSIRPSPNEKPIRVVDLLAHGRQTVLPPTIHPDGFPYQWTSEDTLVDVPVEKLPVLPDDIADLLANALEPFGFVADEEHHEIVRGTGDSLWREVNDAALKNLDRWVPALRLPKTHKAGRGWRATALWRGVDSANVSFHPEGIKDWGNNESHTPIDVVMKALTCDLYMATKWLCEQIGYQPAHLVTDDFDVAAFVARALAKKEVPKRTLQAPPQVDSAGPLPVNSVASEVVAAPRGKVDPFELAKQGGLLGLISQWIVETARVPVAEFATLAALSFLAAFFGRRYVTPTGAGLNVYLIGIAGPGFGKDHPRRAIEMLGHQAQFQWLIGPNDVTSDSAIEKVLRTRPCFVMPWDEVGVFLQSVSGKNSSSWQRTVRKSLLELYSRSTGVWTGKEHADSKTDSSGNPVFAPTVSVFGTSTPTEFYAGITEQNFADGMVARMVVISVKERPERKDVDPVLNVPDALKNELRKAYTNAAKAGANLQGTADRDSTRMPIFVVAQWGAGALDRWRELETWQLDLCDEQPEKEGIVGRAAEQTIKLATIRAISRNPAAPVVTVDDVEWGWAIIQRSLDVIDEGARRHMASSEFEALHKRILSIIEDAGAEGIARSIIMRRRGVSKYPQRDVDQAIGWLETTGQIQNKAGGTGVKYVATNATC